MNNTYLVTYHQGLGTPIRVEAESPAEAKNIALAEYRRTQGSDETVSTLTLKQVIADVTLIGA